MHRFYLPSAPDAGGRLELAGGEARHALKVLRVQPGERLVALDGAGHERLCEVAAVTPPTVPLRVLQRTFHPAPPCLVTLCVAVPKGKLIETIIQKAVELGVSRVVPLLTERVITQLDGEGAEQKRAKWQQVACEAIKQCGAVWLPRIEPPAGLREALAREAGAELALLGALTPPRQHPRACLAAFRQLHGRPPRTASLWIGPEGDFSPAETAAILQAGVQPVTLGPLTLRVETAAVCGLAALNHELTAPIC